MLERPSRRSTRTTPLRRPVATVRRAAGRHRTLWRVGSAAVAIAVALSFQPEPQATPIVAADEAALLGDSDPGGHSPSATLLPDGHAGVAVMRSAASPTVAAGDLVHVISVPDPLIVGEERPAAMMLTNMAVIEVAESAVTIAVPTTEATQLVEAIVTGSVVLVAAG